MHFNITKVSHFSRNLYLRKALNIIDYQLGSYSKYNAKQQN